MADERFLFVSTMKNEGPYILEWLAYHRAIGFTDFLIYTNDCEDGSDLLLDRLAQGGFVVHERNEVLRRGPHKSALKYARSHPLYGSADWVSAWTQMEPSGDPRRPLSSFGYELAQVNHYAVRSVDAYIAKRDRGRANHIHETLGLDYWRRWCLGGEEDRSILRHEAAVEAGIEEFKADPVVKALHAAALEWHRARVATLVNEPEVAALKEEI